jgi:hypothetical protein
MPALWHRKARRMAHGAWKTLGMKIRPWDLAA